MTRRRDLMLEDLIRCTHEAEIPISENGEILYWRCRCGQKQFKGAGSVANALKSKLKP